MPKKHHPPKSQDYARIMKTFGERLKKAREAAGFKSAAGFAHAISITPHAYRKYERGKSEPNFDTLTRICEILKLTPNQLLPQAAKGGRRSGDGSPRAAA